MKRQTFEQFLAEEVHYKLFPTVLDDDLPDHFNDWLGTLDVENLMSWAELYGKAQYLAGEEALLAKRTEV
jgi:hypothetical protein